MSNCTWTRYMFHLSRKENNKMKQAIQWLGIIAGAIAGNLVFLFAIGLAGLSDGQDDTASQFAG